MDYPAFTAAGLLCEFEQVCAVGARQTALAGMTPGPE
jgi:hypothetical protein